jgi:hypothetical protein
MFEWTQSNLDRDATFPTYTASIGEFKNDWELT